jgi:hypothetical protein
MRARRANQVLLDGITPCMKTLAAASLVVAALIWAPSAGAAPPTCQGQPATIVGKPGTRVSGTDGVDVVVSGGASHVFTGDGDDLVCVTGATDNGHRVRVKTGAGTDSVLGTTRDTVQAWLGPGSDTFVGGGERDLVKGGELEFGEDDPDYGTLVDNDPDTISTGAGDDVVTASNDDAVSLGGGDDGMNREVLTGKPFAGTMDGGPGRNFLGLDIARGEGQDPGSWHLDTLAGTLSRDGEVQLSPAGFTDFQVRFYAAGEAVSIQGSDRDESFEAYGKYVSATMTIDAGGGDDLIYLARADYNIDDVVVESVDGGPGRDGLRVYGVGGPDNLVVDLADGSYEYEKDGTRTTVPLAGFEDAHVDDIAFLSLLGNSSDNRLTAELPTGWEAFERCRVEISGGKGDDRLKVIKAPATRSTDCAGAALLGRAGNDVLVGSRGDERLIGGPGRDVARGGPGRDVCVAETRMGCERG